MNLDELSRLADAATPGPWHTKPCATGFQHLSDVQPEIELTRGYPACSPHADAAYIAACSPERIKALVAAAQMLRYLWVAENVNGTAVCDTFYDDDPLSTDVPRILAALEAQP